MGQHCPKLRVQQYPFYCDVVNGSFGVAKGGDVNSVCMVHDRDNIHYDVCVGSNFSCVDTDGGIAMAKVSNLSSDFYQWVCTWGEDSARVQLVEVTMIDSQ